MAYEPKIGKDFPIEVEVVAAKTRHTVEVTRSMIATLILVFSLGAIALSGSTCHGSGDCSLLQSVWNFSAAPLGWVLGYYFSCGGPSQ